MTGSACSLTPKPLAILQLQEILPFSLARCVNMYAEFVTVLGKLLEFERQFYVYLKAFICELEQSKVPLCSSPTYA